jgi:hypothetical protein
LPHAQVANELVHARKDVPDSVHCRRVIIRDRVVGTLRPETLEQDLIYDSPRTY